VSEFRNEIRSQKTKMTVLSENKRILTICLAVLTQYWSVMDGQMKLLYQSCIRIHE